MPFYNQNNSDADIESIRRYGRVTVLQGNSGTVTCDVTKYSPLFVPRLSDHKGRVLLQTYKVGDRVSFFPKKADIPEKGCKYVTYKMTLVDGNGCPEPLRANVEGHVAFINDHFGFVRYDKTGKAYFHRDTALTDKSYDLRDVFPLHSRVVFDVHAQPPKNGCQYRAENLRILDKHQPRQNSDQLSQQQASEELDELFHDCDFRDVEEIFSPSSRPDQQATSRLTDERETNRFYSRGRGRMAASRYQSIL
uniref:Uncharacterized protein n=1 Tax=Romanomermis culicivorax TaxID=13658 RepID=A0A915JHF6_ROMCU